LGYIKGSIFADINPAIGIKNDHKIWI